MNALHRRVLVVVGLMALTACSATGGSPEAGLFTRDNLLHLSVATPPAKFEVKNAASLRIQPYVDQRAEKNPRLLGESTVRVMGLTGHELLADREVASMVTTDMRSQFSKAGFEVLGEDADALPKFELSGVVKQLSLNAKDRDEVNLAIETTLTDLATHKVIWSAIVVEKNDKFAGVSGNSKQDLVAYLQRELAVVSRKTVEAVSGLLMAGYPALFNLTPGTKTIAGVTVSTAPIAPVLAPVASLPAASVPDALGYLSVTSKPARAKVYLDEIYFGLTPLRVEVATGVHTLMLKQSAYQTVTEKISVRKAETTEFDVQLER